MIQLEVHCFDKELLKDNRCELLDKNNAFILASSRHEKLSVNINDTHRCKYPVLLTITSTKFIHHFVVYHVVNKVVPIIYYTRLQNKSAKLTINVFRTFDLNNFLYLHEPMRPVF